ncbi:hypothetical protein [uncultured Hyphomicrobium sp.]|uniref:hypothetical protein n=1 Tax=uncultured Hyphomicrobium sp. TaxID=194373 RepID=UPI0025FE6041|nr:hypothetical protein [uncultured Hyphomicrobium sp.]
MQLRLRRCSRQFAFVAIAFLSTITPASAASSELICLKSSDPASLDDLAIACYSDQACTYVEQHNGEALRDYDETSVAAALGREKIEGIVTSSAPIIKQIKGYGYTCVPLPEFIDQTTSAHRDPRRQ